MTRYARRLTTFAAVFLLFFVAAGCGAGGGGTDSAGDGDMTDSGDGQQQEIADVTSLQTTDTVEGTGATAIFGRKLSVYYTGFLYDPNAEDFHGREFDSVTTGDPFTFRLGQGEVIAGWEQGVPGMKVGGSRTLIVPSRLAYGRQGAGPIPPNSAVVFDIELLDVE